MLQSYDYQADSRKFGDEVNATMQAQDAAAAAQQAATTEYWVLFIGAIVVALILWRAVERTVNVLTRRD